LNEVNGVVVLAGHLRIDHHDIGVGESLSVDLGKRLELIGVHNKSILVVVCHLDGLCGSEVLSGKETSGA